MPRVPLLIAASLYELRQRTADALYGIGTEVDLDELAFWIEPFRSASQFIEDNLEGSYIGVDKREDPDTFRYTINAREVSA
jgi:hypothetical protein